MSARDDIYAGIRRSLGVSAHDTARRDVTLARIAAARPGIRPARGEGGVDQRIAMFKAQAQSVAASVSFVADAGSAAADIATFLRAHNLPARLRMGADERLAALPFAASGVEISQGVSDGSDLNGLSHAEGGVAETGTLVLVSGAHNPSTLNFLPDNHIVVLRAGDIAAVYEDVFAALRDRFGKGVMPRTLNMITGPSRSADIEQKLLLGAHGPRRLHIVIMT
ncbi:MAG: lactate utilization protein [Alphaproteobacteria bacterium]|nr:lactate utilization protein [Alphaproteobacteria bacterium]